jgi:iron(III) transport system permease protein
VTCLAVRIATLGYALPGAVLAVGIFIPLAWLDNWLIGLARRYVGLETGLLVQGTLVAMVIAYVARFLAVGHSPIDSAMQRITRSLDEAARSLGVSGVAMLRRLHLPMLRGGLLTALALVFVDVMKEMPITLMLRPFGWETLAVRIFELTSEGEWERAALPAVTLVMAGLVPIVLLVRQTERGVRDKR